MSLTSITSGIWWSSWLEYKNYVVLKKYISLNLRFIFCAVRCTPTSFHFFITNLPAMKDTRVWYLGWEDPLEKGLETHSSILAWRIPQTEEPSRLRSMGSQRVGHNWTTNTDAPTVRDIYKLRKNQTPVALLGLTTEHGSLSWNSVQNQLFLRHLFRPLSLYLCGFLYCMWLNFNKLNTDIRQFHCKHTGFCIRRFLHFVSSFSLDDFFYFCLQLFHPWAPWLHRKLHSTLLFFSLLSPPFIFFCSMSTIWDLCNCCFKVENWANYNCGFCSWSDMSLSMPFADFMGSTGNPKSIIGGSWFILLFSKKSRVSWEEDVFPYCHLRIV